MSLGEAGCPTPREAEEPFLTVGPPQQLPGDHR